MCCALARSTELRHPLGINIRTPLLVPSFSSKGFGRQEGRSEIQEIFEAAQEILTDSMLVSAFDLYHTNLTMPTGGITEIAFVDSGGYETSDQQDLSSPYMYHAEAGDWNSALHLATLDQWPPHVPAVFVSYDSAAERLPIGAQVERALPLTERYSRQLHAFLAKPEPNQSTVDVGAIMSQAANLSRFNILGVTEKEIGDSFIARMRTLATLRMAMDQQRLSQIPIHVFGSLDPMSVCLYFIAGAEIFDGLTWLRYAYPLDSAMYRQNGAVLHELLTQRDSRVRTWAMTQNVGQLEALKNRLRRFLNDRDYTVLPRGGDWLLRAKELLRAEFGGRDI
jgi:hypothetical protein